MGRIPQHEHRYVQYPDAMRCCVCGRRWPLPVLHIRCEFCKELFDWHPRIGNIRRHGVKRTCSPGCAGRLNTWKNNRKQIQSSRDQIQAA